jgi:hypothetical protein
MMNKLRFLTLALFFHAMSSWAMPMNYTFDVNFTNGPIQGTSSTVYVTLSDVDGTGTETFDTLDGSLLAFDFNFGGVDFSLSDVAVDMGPRLTLVDGLLTEIGPIDTTSLWALFVVFNDDPFPPAWDAKFFNPAIITNAAGNFRICGEPTCTFRPLFSTFPYGYEASWARVGAVPSPATLSLFGLGLVGLGINRRKRQAHD